MSDFQPLLASPCEDISKLRYPVLVSPKLDGIRCVVRVGRALSRKLKPIPNDCVRTWVESNLPEGIDGELMLRDHRRPFEEVSSAIMAKDGAPDFLFAAFDILERAGAERLPFTERYGFLRGWASEAGATRLQVVPHELASSREELQAIVIRHLDAGYEGTMVRDPHGRYKFGRSTEKEGILLKIKPWHDEEATVVDVVEQQTNQNPATKDERGYTKRSSAKAGKVGTGKLGTLACVTYDGVEFEIGTGFTDDQRVRFWGMHLIGRQVKFKHLGRMQSGAPRGPVFLGWRED